MKTLLPLLAACCLASSAGADTPTRPNLIFILIDDAGYDDFGFTGCTDWKTPHLDRFASEGVVYSSGYVTASVCGPSRAGLITGRYQQSFGHEENLTGGLDRSVPAEEFGLPLNVPTLGSLLQQKGYRTAAFGKWHLGTHDHFHPNERGFDHFVGFLGGHRSFWPIEKPHKDHRLLENRTPTRTPEYLTDHLGKEAVRFIEQNKDNPFFIYLAYNAVHSPLHATPTDLEALANISDEKRQVLGAMTLALDRSVGDVLSALKKHGIDDNTLVVFTNDNGAATYLKTNNGGLRGRKGTVWEGGLRVPYAARWPGTLSPKSCDTPVNTLDVGYTFCRRAGFTPEELRSHQLAGSDLVDIANGSQPDRALYWRRGNTAAIRNGDWKLITTNKQPAFLFNLEKDPGEENNLLQEAPEKTKALQHRLSLWDRSLPAPLWRKKVSDQYDQFLLKYWPES